MRFTIIKDEFLKAVTLVAKPIQTKSIVPSLTFIKITLDNRGLNLIGSNETVAISTTIPFIKNEKEIIRNYQNGAILVQGRFLNDITHKLSDNEFSFEVIDGTVVEIKDNKSSFQLNSAQAEEYPDYDFNEPGKDFTVNTKDFIELVEQTAFAADTKETRPMLTALNITAGENKITSIALDGARYAKKEINIKENVEFVANIPAKTISEIIRMFENTNELKVTVNERKIFFKFNNTIISSNLLNGDYPNVKKIVPNAFEYILEVNSQEFLSAIDRVSLLSNDKNIVKLVMSENEVEVSSTTNENGSANEKINTFQFTGDRLEIFFNSKFLIEAIKALKSEDMIIQFVGEMKPFLVKNNDKNNFIQLITPARA